MVYLQVCQADLVQEALTERYFVVQLFPGLQGCQLLNDELNSQGNQYYDETIFLQLGAVGILADYLSEDFLHYILILKL